MVIRKITLLAAAMTAAVASAAPADTLRLTREQCIEIALSDNPTVRVADMEITRSDWSKRENLAQLFPNVSFGVNYSRAIELQTIRMNMGGQSQSIKMGSDNQWSMGFQASVPVVAPQLWQSLKLSDTQILAAAEQARSSRLTMVNAVNKAYYALLMAKASREVLQKNYDIAKFNASLFEKKFAAGTASEYDVLRSSVQVKNVEPELLQADIAVRQARLQLKVLLGLDAAAEVEPTISLSDLRTDMYALGAKADYSPADNSQLRQLDLQAKSACQNVTLKKLAWVPTLSATFSYSWNSLSNGNMFKHLEFNPYSTVGFSLSVPIFSGGSKYSGLKQAQIAVTELALQRENLERNLRMQIDLAVDNINRQARQISASEDGMKQAAKAYEIMQKSFEIGAATYLDLRDSELANTTAQLSYYQSIYEYLVSASDLDELLGRGVPEKFLNAQKSNTYTK